MVKQLNHMWMESNYLKKLNFRRGKCLPSPPSPLLLFSSFTFSPFPLLFFLHFASLFHISFHFNLNPSFPWLGPSASPFTFLHFSPLLSTSLFLSFSTSSTLILIITVSFITKFYFWPQIKERERRRDALERKRQVQQTYTLHFATRYIPATALFANTYWK